MTALVLALALLRRRVHRSGASLGPAAHHGLQSTGRTLAAAGQDLMGNRPGAERDQELECVMDQIRDLILNLEGTALVDAFLASEWLLHERQELAIAAQEPLHQLTERMIILRCTDKGSHPSRHLGEILRMGNPGDLLEFTAGDTQRFSERPRRDIVGASTRARPGGAFRPRCPSCRRDTPLGSQRLRQLFDGLETAGKFDTRNVATIDLSLIPATFEERSE